MVKNNKKIVRLTETELRKVISESVKRVLKESPGSDPELVEKWNALKDKIGAEEMLNCIFYRTDDETLRNILEQALCEAGLIEQNGELIPYYESDEYDQYLYT